MVVALNSLSSLPEPHKAVILCKRFEFLRETAALVIPSSHSDSTGLPFSLACLSRHAGWQGRTFVFCSERLELESVAIRRTGSDTLCTAWACPVLAQQHAKKDSDFDILTELAAACCASKYGASAGSFRWRVSYLCSVGQWSASLLWR